MVGDLMDLHVYALLKRKYNDLAESVEGLVDESAELTEEARKTLAEAQDKLDEIKPLLETSKDNVKISEEQTAKVQEMLDELEPAVADIEAIIKQALQNVHTGEYESDREYLKGNETLYNGSTYRALEDVTGVLPTDTSKWQLVAQRGVDGEGAVSSVNNIAPDENGNVDLGNISTDWNSLEGKPEVLDDLGESDGKLTYKGEEVGEKLVIGRKAYVADGNTTTFKTEFEVEPNTNRVMVYVSGVIQSSGENFTENNDSITLNFTPAKGTQVLVYTFSGSETLFVDGGINEEDIKHLETKVDAIKKLEEAKSYTDGEIAKIPDVDTSKFVTTEHIYQNSVTTSETGTAFSEKAKAGGRNAIALGKASDASGNESVAIGNVARGIGWNSVAIGDGATASGTSSIALTGSSASKANSFSFGMSSYAESVRSVAIGLGAKTARMESIALGNFNGIYNGGEFDRTGELLVVGNGAGVSKRSNALHLHTSGDLTIMGEYKTGGADYAEMFEWEDKNPKNADRVALAVTWGEGESIKLANAGDEIIGIVSSTPAILGDNPMEWDKRYVTDQFGRPLRKVIEVETEDGEVVEKEWFVENPEYDKEATYTARTERDEWDAVGLMGKLYWIDDGTLNVGDYATVGEDGKAVKGNKDNGYRVLKRISKNVDGESGIIKVFFK